MLDTITTLLEIADKAVSRFNFLEWRKRKKLTGIGVKLHNLYVALNDLIVTGRIIVAQMQRYVDSAKPTDDTAGWTLAGLWSRRPDGRRTSDSTINTGKRLQIDVAIHIANLRKAADSIQAMAPEFEVLDPESYREVRLLFADKVAMVNGLFAVYFSDVTPDALPLDGLTQQQLEESYALVVSKSGGEQLRTIAEVGGTLVEHSCPKQVVKLDQEWDRHVYPVIKSYLETAQPEKQLDRLEEILGSFREILQDNFEVKDLLLNVRREPQNT